MTLGQILTLFALTPRLTRSRKAFLAATAGLVLVLIVLLPNARALAFDALARYTNAGTLNVDSRGWSPAQIAKIPLTLFFFTFGESVYPLTYGFVVPGVIVFGVAGVSGLVRMWRNSRAFWFVAVAGTTGLGLLYLVFDPLAPSDLQGAAPRYLIFLIPLFYLLMAAGAQARASWLIVPMLLVNLGSLGFYWYGDWAYTDDLVNWREVAQWVGERVTPQTVLVMDGRAQDVAKTYFPGGWNRKNAWSYETAESLGDLAAFSRIILLSYDLRANNRIQMSGMMGRIDSEYNLAQAWGKYPLFVYVYDRKAEGQMTVSVDSATGSVGIPVGIYGLEFQDVQLPISLTLGKRQVQSVGAFALPSLQMQTSQALLLERTVSARRIWLLSTLTGANPDAGTVLGMLTVNHNDGSSSNYQVRAGYETNAWDGQCQPSACLPAFTWRKRLALVGAEGYPGSWREFDASIFAGGIDLHEPVSIRSLKLEREDSTGTLHVWGMVLEP